MEQMEAPPELLMTLLPYQKEFLAWAVKQEQGDIKGGILADEMGMGKTIQVQSTYLNTLICRPKGSRAGMFCHFGPVRVIRKLTML